MPFEFSYGAPTWRPVIMGWRGAVASNQPLATQAGAEILRAGGNAADAAVAVASTLGVVEPQMSGVGGDGFLLFYDARARRATVVNGTGPTPGATTPERYAGGFPANHLSTSVPGSVDSWLTLLQRFGTRPAREVFAPAIYHAREGYGCTRRLRDFIVREQHRLRLDERAAATFLPGGSVPRVGGVIRQPDLARTLEAIADGGRDVLYEGEIGRAVADFCRQEGGILAFEDLSQYHAEVQEPIRTTYRGYEILQSPPNSMGWTLLEELNIVEQFDLSPMGALSADALHVLVEAKKLAFADRERYSGDPSYTEAPLERLLDKRYAAELAARIDARRATPRFTREAAAVGGGETTYFCVVDGDGNAVSGIQSIHDAFGSARVAGNTGILLNDRMRMWHLEPGHPNTLLPGKRVRHTMNTPLAIQDGQVRAVWGTPGGDAQVQINLQTITALVDFGLDPQQAVEAPRWCSFEPGQESNWPHTSTERLEVEDRLPLAVREDLAGRGHNVQVVGPLEGPCSAEVIVRLPDGLLAAASDPRRDGYALAW
ncbi:MAG: gamma-glutamyltransferase [Chloroflexi bacterium]|nr:gamma-glutamyltransferase [Chloroflexota bacterium]